MLTKANDIEVFTKHTFYLNCPKLSTSPLLYQLGQYFHPTKILSIVEQIGFITHLQEGEHTVWDTMGHLIKRVLDELMKVQGTAFGNSNSPGFCGNILQDMGREAGLQLPAVQVVCLLHIFKIKLVSSIVIIMNWLI